MTAQELRLKLATDDDLVCNCLVLIHRDVGFRGSDSFCAFLTSLVTRIIKAHTMAGRWTGPLLSPGQLRPARNAITAYADDLAGVYARHAEGIDWSAMNARLTPKDARPTQTAQLEERQPRQAPPEAQDAATLADFEEGPSPSVGVEGDVHDVNKAYDVAQTAQLEERQPRQVVKAPDVPSTFPGGIEAHRRRHPGDFRADGTLRPASEF